MKSIQIQTNNFNNNIIILFIITLYLIGFEGKADWTQTGPEGGSFFIKENNGVLYSTNAIGLYKSTDNGFNWNRVSTFTGFTMNDLVFTPNKMIASTNKGIFYSIDGGVNWVSSNQGLSNADTTGLGTFFIYQVSNSRILTSVLSGTYISDNNGQTWSLSNGGMPFNAICQQSNLILGLGAADIYQSTDNGQTWTISSNNGISLTDISNMVKIFSTNNTLVIGCNSTSAYTSTDNGQNWNLTSIANLNGNNQGSIYLFNNTIYKKTSTGYFSLDILNNTWITNNISQTYDIFLRGYSNGRFFATNGIYMDDVSFSDNNGLTWQTTNGVKCMIVSKIAKSDFFYVLGDNAAFILDSSNLNFTRSSPYNTNYSANTYSQYNVLDIKKRSNGTIYLATAGGVWKSINNGASYTQSYNGLPFSTSPGTNNTYTVYDMFISGTFPNDTLLVGTTNGIYFSTDDAQTFTQVPSTNGKLMIHFLKHQGILYCAGTGVFKRTSANNWTQFTTSNTGVSSFAAAGDYLFITANNSPVKYAHVNGLTNFANIITGSGNFAYSVAAYDTLVFYCSNNGVFKLNITLLGSVTQTDLVQIADNLPYYNNPGNVKQYSYLNSILAGNKMAIFNGKLWLGTNGMSTFYRSLNDFGYSLTVGGEDNMRQEQGVVYPNPSNDKITMTNFTIGSNLTIYNSVGQLVLNMTYTNSQTIDLSKINSGLYTYLIIDNKQNIIDNGKFVKE